MHFSLISVTLFSAIFKLLLVYCPASRRLISYCIWDALSLQSVFWSHMITASSGMCSCASVFLYITFGFFFVLYVCRAAVVPELTGQKTTPNSPKGNKLSHSSTVIPHESFHVCIMKKLFENCLNVEP